MAPFAQRFSPSTRPRRARGRRWLATLAASLLLTTLAAINSAEASTTSTGDAAVVNEWNTIAVDTLVNDTTKKPPETGLYLAFVQAAVYDAVVGVDGRYRPYRFHAHARHGTSARAAAVAAAHKILVTYSPAAQTELDAQYAASLAKIPDGPATDQGIAFGIAAADNLISLRSHDGRDADVEFAIPLAPGVWRPTPPGMAKMLDPWLGGVTPLLVRSATQFGPSPPPALTSARYTRDFAEVKALGSATSTARTSAQTSTATFFSGNALVQYNYGLRGQVAVRHLDIVDAARMFAAIDMSVADAIITVWRAKLFYGLWRPITAINLADTDGNPATTADPNWQPLIANPAYPEYPSGYNAFNATVTGGLENLFHTRHLNLTLNSTAVPNAFRTYDSGSVLRQDVVDARIWLGIHFRFADTASRRLGLQLTDWTLDHYFQPLDD